MSVNPQGFIPVVGQGLRAREHQEGTEGGKEWLKSIKLHKYWPTFSQWSYSEFMSLSEENLDTKLAKIGSTGMTSGAKGRLLLNLNILREREQTLVETLDSLKSGKIALRVAFKYLRTVLRTPLPLQPASSIAYAIVATVVEVQTFILKQKFNLWSDKTMKEITNELNSRPVLRITLDMVHGKAFSTRSAVQPVRKLQEPKVTQHKPSTDKSGGIWPQEENSVMFNIWPQSLLEELIDDIGCNTWDIPSYPWESSEQQIQSFHLWNCFEVHT